MIHSQLASLWKEVLSIRGKASFSFSLTSPTHTHARYHYQPLQHFISGFKENIEKYLVFSDGTKLKGCIIFFFFFMIYLFIHFRPCRDLAAAARRRTLAAGEWGLLCRSGAQASPCGACFVEEYRL